MLVSDSVCNILNFQHSPLFPCSLSGSHWCASTILWYYVYNYMYNYVHLQSTVPFLTFFVDMQVGQLTAEDTIALTFTIYAGQTTITTSSPRVITTHSTTLRKQRSQERSRCSGRQAQGSWSPSSLCSLRLDTEVNYTFTDNVAHPARRVLPLILHWISELMQNKGNSVVKTMIPWLPLLWKQQQKVPIAIAR